MVDVPVQEHFNRHFPAAEPTTPRADWIQVRRGHRVVLLAPEDADVLLDAGLVVRTTVDGELVVLTDDNN